MSLRTKKGSNPRLPRGPRGWAALHFAKDKVEFALARETDGQVQIVRESVASAVAGVRPHVDPREHHIVTGMACEDVLCRALRLPTINDDELRQMLALQIDQLTPVPLEEVVYDFEPLEQKDGHTLVLVAIARKSVVNERVAALENAGLPPERVGVDAIALFRELCRRNLISSDEKLNTVVILHPDVAHMIVYSHGHPLLVRSVFSSADLALSVAALGEELSRTQLAAQVDWPGREQGRVTIVTTDPHLQDAAREIASVWETEATFLVDGEVPSTASCLCPQTKDEHRFNLLPDEWRQQRRAARFRRMALRMGIVLGVVYLLVLAGFVVAQQLRKSRLNSLDAQLKQLEPEYAATRQLQGTLIALENQLDTRYSALDVLRVVSEALPPDLKLNAFVFRRDDIVTLKGQANSAEAVYEFINRLQKGDLFSEVKAINVATQGGLTKFELVATLKSAVDNPGGGG